MATIKPFPGIRPQPQYASAIAALPYDVYSREEAKAEVASHPLSFLRIDRPETQFPDGFDMYSAPAYAKARELLQEMIQQGFFKQDERPFYYIYSLTREGRTQTGLVGCGSIDDYENNVIKKHENTRPGKELDRFHHIEACQAQTGPVFMAYQPVKEISDLLLKIKIEKPIYDFVADDQVRHQVWVVEDNIQINKLEEAFKNVESIYIADGHHRAESAAKVGLKHREDHPNQTGDEPYNYMMAVFFAQDQLEIMDYNRYVSDLNGHSPADFLDKIKSKYTLLETGETCEKPAKKGQVAMYLNGSWYSFDLSQRKSSGTSPIDNLDVSLLQEEILAPILGIEDPKSSPRIHFIGGIRGTVELERRSDQEGGVAFAMYPTAMGELFEVADANLLMPPKSTWFEPKLRSGLFVHKI